MKTSSSCKDSEKGAENENQNCFELPSNYEELQLQVHVGSLDDLYLDIVSPPFQAFGNDIGILSSDESISSQPVELNEEKPYSFPSASLEILRHCRSRNGTESGKKLHVVGHETMQQSLSQSPLSTNDIIELAAGNFIQSKSGTWNELCAMSHPYASTFLGLSTGNGKDIQLVRNLLSCAEKVCNEQYDCAIKLLDECYKLSFGQTNVIQRLVYYFVEALFDKIGKETGKYSGKYVVDDWPVESTVISSAIAAFHQQSPLNQVAQFTAIQSVVDHASACRKVHIVGLEIRCAVQQMIIMQALAARSGSPLECFKLTALSTSSNHMVEEAGVRLRSLAESLNLNFSFHVIILEDIQTPHRSLFDLDPEETVVVYATHALDCLIPKPNQLEALMRLITNINPHVMIINESEGNVNSPFFVNRFVEALFFYGAYFECVEDCLKNDAARNFVESELFSPAIRNCVVAEGEERKVRIVGVNVWRAFFSRFGIVETELSKLALDHANSVLHSFDCRDSCTLVMNGKCLIVGWKGTPIFAVSTWKFQGRRCIIEQELGEEIYATQDQIDSCEDMNSEKETQKHADFNGVQDSVDSFSYCSDLVFLQGHNYDIEEAGLFPSKYEEQQLLAHLGGLDDLYFDVVSPPFQAFGDDFGVFSTEKSQNSSHAFPSASMEILRQCRSRVDTVSGKKIHVWSHETRRQPSSPSPLSTNQIIELAAGSFIGSKSGTFLGPSMENNNDTKGTQLVQNLLSCADKVCNKQYDSASKLLEECNNLSFCKISTIQRLVYYFTEALRLKIERETGRLTGKHIVNNWLSKTITPGPETATFLEKLPFNQVTMFTGVQSVADHLSDCRKVHIVDLELRSGVQQTVLMEALVARSECPIEHFKITAITTKLTHLIEETGIRLKSLAASLNLNFSYNVITLKDVLDLHESLFELDNEETVVVYATYALLSMIATPTKLDILMGVIRNISPSMMIVTEAEANVNSLAFVDRFVEALFFYGAYFDSLEDCLKNDVAERTVVESKFFSPAIRNTVAGEGEERMFRMVGINVWREFFSRFGMVEMQLSGLSLHHANLVLNRFQCRDHCSLGLNGKCLIVGWKGTPICSLSAWKFQGTRVM